jgi:hypothetical protein
MAQPCSFWARVKFLEKDVVKRLQSKKYELKSNLQFRRHPEEVAAFWYSCPLEERVFYWANCPPEDVEEYLANCTPEEKAEYLEIFGV